MLPLILVIVLVVLALAVLPLFPYSRGWGYFPGGTIFVILVVLLILWLIGVV